VYIAGQSIKWIPDGTGFTFLHPHRLCRPAARRRLASFTYGPLPGLFAFGMMTTRTLNVNGALVFAGLFAISRRATASPAIAAA
jgi:hypothetical protein